MPYAYNSSDVRRIVGIPQRSLDYWVERGIVTPTVAGSRGKGKERRFSFEDLVRLRVVKQLREVGLPLDKIRRALRKMRAQNPDEDPLLDEALVTDGKTLYKRLPTDQLADVLAGGQLVLNIVQVGLIREETKQATIRLERKRAQLTG